MLFLSVYFSKKGELFSVTSIVCCYCCKLDINFVVIQNQCCNTQPGVERVEAVADIARSALCCHSNKTHVLIANPPNSAQLKGTPYHSPNLHPGPRSSV